MTNSRQKGKRGEREAAKQLTGLFGVECRRGQQFQGSSDSPDVVGLPGVHVEVKHTDSLRLYDAVAQAVRDGGSNIPMVLHRKTRGEWLAVVRLDDLPALAYQLNLILMAKGS